jgi:hypothetical protein
MRSPNDRRATLKTRRRIDRLVEALTAGSEPMLSVRAALVGFEREVSPLSATWPPLRRVMSSPRAGLRRSWTSWWRRLPGFARSSRQGPEERKAVVRTFLRGIRINQKAGQATLTWFRLPALQNVGLKLVELRGVEPLTPRLPALCSPN